MSEPYLAEIRIFGFNFAPRGWAECDGQLLPISQNTALFSLLGTIYGGDGRMTFGLPDLRGRVPIQEGTGAGLTSRQLGEQGGSEQVTLTAAQNPPHTHPMNGTTETANNDRVANRLPSVTPLATYKTSGTQVSMAGQVVATTGGQPHENMQPWLALKFCIAIQGLFPSRS